MAKVGLLRLAKILWKISRQFWYARNRIPGLRWPIPYLLPYGGWFMLYPDEMGANLILWPVKKPIFEEGEWRFISKVLKRGMVGMDIGANQGFYTILLAKLVGDEGKIFAFEPVPDEFRKLKMNLRLNKCAHRVVLENCAVSSREGIYNMFVCLDGYGSRSSFRPPPEEVRARTKNASVLSTTLDQYVHRHNLTRLDFVKIDVEGSERDVLIGGTNTFVKLRPIVMIEMADVATKQFGYNACENYQWLEEHGFALFEVTFGGLLRPGRQKESYRENLFAIPEEKVRSISHLVDRL